MYNNQKSNCEKLFDIINSAPGLMEEEAMAAAQHSQILTEKKIWFFQVSSSQTDKRGIYSSIS